MGRESLMSTTKSSTTANVVVVVVVVCLVQQVSGYRPYPDPGPDIPLWQEFCGTRQPGDRCCPNRVDSCTVPILRTLCYCDDFCDRTISDCCPDFWSECRGLRPQPFNMSTTPRPPYTSQCEHFVAYAPYMSFPLYLAIGESLQEFICLSFSLYFQ